MSRAIHETALQEFGARLRYWFEYAEGEPRLTEVIYENGVTSVDIDGDLHIVESDLDDEEVRALSLRAATCSDDEINRDNPDLSIVIPPDWRATFIRPPTVQRPAMFLRKLRRRVIPLAEYVEKGAMTWEQKLDLEALVRDHQTILIAGPTGGGKTTMARALLDLVDPSERIVTIEDARELFLTAADGVSHRPHWTSLLTSEARDMAALLRLALRCRPTRIVVGEVRGPEAIELIRACTTGHRGGIFTIHAEGGEDAIDRLWLAAQQAQDNFPRKIASLAIDAVVKIIGLGRARRVDEVWRNPHAAE